MEDRGDIGDLVWLRPETEVQRRMGERVDRAAYHHCLVALSSTRSQHDTSENPNLFCWVLSQTVKRELDFTMLDLTKWGNKDGRPQRECVVQKYYLTKLPEELAVFNHVHKQYASSSPLWYPWLVEKSYSILPCCCVAQASATSCLGPGSYLWDIIHSFITNSFL